MLTGPGATSVTFTVHSTTPCLRYGLGGHSEGGVCVRVGGMSGRWGWRGDGDAPVHDSSLTSRGERSCRLGKHNWVRLRPPGLQLTSCSNRLPTAMVVKLSESATAAK